MEMFEKAAREKTRFPFKGQLSVEDLWDLSVQELDRIFKSLNAKLRICKEESLLGPKEKADTDLEFQVNIIKHIVGVKLAEAQARELEASKRLQKQKILSIMAEKQDENLRGKSVEELSTMLDSF